MSHTRIMGIINITPDSFSADGLVDARDILEQVQTMLTQGADIIDVGAESTRPGATSLSADEEWQRLHAVLPDMLTLTHKAGKQLSLDTRHGQTAARALDLGVDIINDVSGCHDDAMLNALQASACDIVCMHSLTVPADPSITLDEDDDVVSEISSFAQHKIAQLEARGIAKDRIIFDPGIGFNKTAAQSLELIRRIAELNALGVRLLVGHSRKSFLQPFTDAAAPDRDALTLAVSQFLMQHEVSILRVHHVAWHHQLQSLYKALYAPE